MTSINSEIRFLAELSNVKNIAEELGYSAQLFEKSEEIAYPALSVVSGVDKSGDPVHLTFMFYPIEEEMPNTNLLQLFTQMGFTIEKGEEADFYKILPAINNRLPIGHFSIDANLNKVQFRYVHCFPKLEILNKDNIHDMIVMSNYIVTLFSEILSKLADHSYLIEEASAKVDSIFSGK